MQANSELMELKTQGQLIRGRADGYEKRVKEEKLKTEEEREDRIGAEKDRDSLRLEIEKLRTKHE